MESHPFHLREYLKHFTSVFRTIRVRRDLGNVCENMWKASGNNMLVGIDLTVDTSNTATKLFTLTKTGEAKLQNTVYTKFKGKIFKVLIV